MSPLFSNLIGELRPRRTIYVVSGLPRSGTSMMMKMLEAGGLPVMTDNVRQADEDNPKGYYEVERVKDLETETDKSWLAEADGKVIKVISFLLKDLPGRHRYKVIFMRRNLKEILASQHVMLERRDERIEQANEAEAIAVYERHLKKVGYQMRHRPRFDFLYIDYRESIDRPEAAAHRVNRFLGGGLDVGKMVEAVDRRLYRQRSE